MKKILSVLVCVCVLLSAMVFAASAADVTNVVLTSDSLALGAYNTDVATGSVEGVNFEWIQLGTYDGNGIQVRDKDGNTSSFWNTTAFSAPIKEIKLVFSANKPTYDNPDAEIFSFGNAVDSYTYSTKLSTTAGVKEYTITPDAETYTYLHFEHDLGYTMYWDSITIVLVGGKDATPPAGGDDEVDTTPSTVLVDAPVAGTAYKFAMDQTNVGQLLFANGEMSGYYMATVTDPADAIDVYLEEVSGGYNLYGMVNGAKKYLNMVVSGTYVNAVYGDTAENVYTYDTTLKTVVTEINNSTYAFGTYSTYKTIGTSDVVAHPDNFFARFYTVDTTEDDGDVTPPSGDEDDEEIVPPVELPAPDATNTLTIEEALDLGAAQDSNGYTEDKYYVIGKITAVTNDMYGNMYIADENGNEILVYGTYGADGVDRYDALESKPDEGDTVTLYGVVGNYNGAPQMKNAWIIEFTEGEPDAPETTDPAADSVLTIKEAIDLGLSKRHNEFTENMYYVTGVITEIYNDMYGNMYITDDEGNVLTLYGTYDEEGNRFDAMTVQPAVGDTVTVYGIIGQYNGVAQMKNGVFTTAPVGDNNAGNVDNSTTSPSTGDNAGALVAFAIAAAAVLVCTSKKR